jgi:heme-degrading monooxygenase HmoA
VHARAAYYRVERDRLGEAEDAFRTAGGQIAQLDGFERGIILADPEAGTIVTITVWTNGAKMEASEVRAASIRQSAVKGVQGDVERVERYEVVTEL